MHSQRSNQPLVIIVMCGLALLSVAALFLPGQLSSAASLILFLTLVIRERDFVKSTLKPVLFPLLCVIGFFVVISVHSEYTSKSFKGTYDFLRALFLAVGVLWMMKQKQSSVSTALTWLIAISLTICIPGLLFMYASFADFEFYQISYRIGWTFSQNVVATECSLIFLMSVLLFFISSDNKKRVLALVSAGLFLWMIIATGSRGTVLALVLTVMVFVFLRASNRHRLIISLFLVFGLVGVSFLGLENIKTLFPYFYHGNELEFLISGEGADRGRVPVYLETVKAFKESWLLGYGANTFKYFPFSQGYTHAHSIYLDLIISAGVAGALFVVATVWLFLKLTPIDAGVQTVIDSDRFSYWYAASVILLLFSLTRGLFDLELFDFSFLSMVMVGGAGIAVYAPQRRSISTEKNDLG